MFGWWKWWKRNEGFEWREYVRTTILLRRKHRRERLDEIKVAAVEGVKKAGKQGAAASATGLALGWLRLKATLAALGRSTGTGLAALGRTPGFVMQKLAPALQPGFARMGAALRPAAEKLAEPRISGPLLVLGMVAAIAAAVRVPSRGFDQETTLAVTVALVALLVGGVPLLWARGGMALPHWLGGGRLPRISTSVVGGVLAAAVVALLGGGGWLWLKGGSSAGSFLASMPISATKPISGRATAVSGDVLRLGGTSLRLSGIEAPERDQRCARPGNKSWRCGDSARDGLGKLVNGKLVTCELSGNDSSGMQQGACRVDGADIAATLVRQGHVFAAQGLFARYASAELEARNAKAGLWRGEAERPSDWRAKRWEEANRAAPEGCPIKGQVSSEGKVYVLPWSRDYDRVKVRTTKGERWFCSEQEARAAGFKAPERS